MTGCICLNENQATWVSSDPSNRSILDLVFADHSIALSFSVEVLDFPYGSDYFPVLIARDDTSILFKPLRSTIVYDRVD